MGGKGESSVKLAHSIANQLDEMSCHLLVMLFLSTGLQLQMVNNFWKQRQLGNGYPFIKVVGKSSTNTIPLFELHDLNQNVDKEMTVSEILSYLSGINQPNV